MALARGVFVGARFVLILLPLEEPLVFRVAANMRALDRAEIYAVRWRENPAEVARDGVLLSRFGFVGASSGDGEPIVAVGAAELWPTMWSLWMFATDRWPEVAAGATRAALRVLRPLLLAAGGRRAECRSLVGHRQAHRWLRMLGARPEGRLRGFGKNGEDFICFVWRPDDVHGRRKPEPSAGAGAAAFGRRDSSRGAGGAAAGGPGARARQHHPDFADGRQLGNTGRG